MVATLIPTSSTKQEPLFDMSPIEHTTKPFDKGRERSEDDVSV